MTSYSRLDEAWHEPFANFQQSGLGMSVENSDLLSVPSPVSVPEPVNLVNVTPPPKLRQSSDLQKPVVRSTMDPEIHDVLLQLQQRVQILESSVANLATETKTLRTQNNTDLYTFIAVGVAAIFVLDTFANKK